MHAAIAATVTFSLVAGGIVAGFAFQPEAGESIQLSAELAAMRALTGAEALLSSDEPGPAPSELPPAVPQPEAPAGPGFSVTCANAKSIPVQSGDAMPCKVVSRNGFSQPVALACLNLPSGLACEPLPNSVTPPPNGVVEFHLGLSNTSVKTGKHSFKVVGTSGGLSSTFNYPFNISPGVESEGLPGAPAELSCSSVDLNAISRGASRTTSCRFVVSPGFQDTVSLSCEPIAGLSCSVNPTSVSPRFGQEARFSLSVTASPDQPAVPTKIVVKGSSPGLPGGPISSEFGFRVLPSLDYTIACDPSQITVYVLRPTTVGCRLTSGTFSGQIALDVFGTIVNGSLKGPFVQPSQKSIAVSPGSSTQFDLTVPQASWPGSYEYRIVAQDSTPYGGNPNTQAKEFPFTVHVNEGFG